MITITDDVQKFMNEKIRTLLSNINALEEELATTLREQQSKMFFQIDRKRIEFESSVREGREKLKSGIFQWLVPYRPQNLLTDPINYGETKLENFRLALGKHE